MLLMSAFSRSTRLIRPVLAAIAIAAAGVTLASPASAQQVQARTVVELNARSGPGQQFPIQFVIPQGTVVPVLTCTQAFDWCQVVYQGQSGWSSSQFLQSVDTQQPMQEMAPVLGPIFSLLFGVIGDAFGFPPPPPPQPEPEPEPPLPAPGPNEVCFYRDVNFAGAAACVNMGSSNSSISNAWNDVISSIRVGQGAQVQVCGDVNYQGWCQTYVDDVNLTGFRNDSISSYRTVGIPQQPQPPQPQPQPPANALQAYASLSLNARSGPDTQFPVQYVIPTNGTVQLIQCTVGYSWCQLSYFGQTAWSSAQYLLSSVNGQPISQVGAQLGIPVTNQVPQPPQPQPPALPTPAANEACFYTGSSFNGNAFCVSVGNADFSLTSPFNNTISSIRVGANASVQVCGDPNLSGWCQIYTDDVTLTSFRDNSISSYRTLSAGAPQPTIGVCFYEFTGYGGASFCIDDGETLNTLPQGWNDRISSIRVDPGFTVQVCRDTGLWGWCEQYTANVPALSGDRNDAISSVRTRP